MPPGQVLAAPDTRCVEVFTSLDRGFNFYGPLCEEFFVCDDLCCYHRWTVLWMTLNAAQEEDDVQRLQPVCLLAADWLPQDLGREASELVDRFAPRELEGLILLWAFARHEAEWK